MDYVEEDVGNIVLLEHVNLQVPDQNLASLFYVVGLGLTRDPYLTVGLENMWINVGEQQFHLPTRKAQILQGHIGLVMPELDVLQKRLEGVAKALKKTRFTWSAEKDHIAVTCPWGNRFHCYAADGAFGDMALGIPYVEFLVKPGTAVPIGRFYEEVLGATYRVEAVGHQTVARVKIGRNQALVFRESRRKCPSYDGYHIAVYVAHFSGPYGFFKRRGLILEDVRNHQFRFNKVVDPSDGKQVFALEHEVRSLHHPLYRRHFVNRDPRQSQRSYLRGRDAFIPFRS